jgi:hypothetical protein
MEGYVKIINDSKISDASKETYIYSLKRAEKATGMSISDVVNNPDESAAKLNNAIPHAPSLKITIASILAVLKHSGLKLKDKTLFNKWYRHYMPLLKEANDNRVNNVPSKRQLAAVISWDVVRQMYEKIKTAEYGSDRHLLLAFYYLMCPRRQEDYYEIFIKKNMKQNDSEYGAVLDMTVARPVINVRIFKTAKTMQPWSKQLPSQLVNILTTSLEKHPRMFVFVQNNGEKFSNRNSFTQYSNRILKSMFGKNVTVNSLRHAYSTYRNHQALTLKERKNDSYDMGHSLETHLSYAVDVDKKKYVKIVKDNTTYVCRKV